MNQLFIFLQHHWELSSLFIIIIFAIILLEAKEKSGTTRTVTPEKAVDLMNHDNAILVDLREKELFTAGHIIDAVNFTDKDVTKLETKLKNKKQKPIIIVGNNDQEASKIAAELIQKGFEQTKVLAGGMKSWKDSDLPIEK